MNSRRSLADALQLDPKKLEFIHGKKAAPVLPPKPEPKEDPKEEPKVSVAPVEVKPEAEAKQPVEIKTEEKPAEREPEVRSQKADDADETPKRSAPRKSRERSRRQAEERSSAPTALTQATVPVTTRFRQATAEALRRASLERKLAGETPSSQQEIVELCVSSWLRSNGYLDDAR